MKKGENMTGRKVDLFILESLWDDKLVSETSVRPFFEGLSRVYDIKYVYHTFHSEENIRYFIEESKRQKLSCPNYYIAAHGSRKCIHGLNDEKINGDSLIDIFKNFQGRSIYFGSCNFINDKTAEDILINTKADWVAGYNREVDWFDSTIIDLAFWRYYLKGVENKKIKETQWKIAPEIYKKYPFSINLGFSVFDRAPHQKTINNSLQEFKQNNPDFMKRMKDNK